MPADDTRSFTVDLEAVCPDPSASITKVSQDNRTVVVDIQMSPGAGETYAAYYPLLDWGDGEQEDNPVNGRHSRTYSDTSRSYDIQIYANNSCGNRASDKITVTVEEAATPGKATITEYTAPASVKKGSEVMCGVTIRNDGETASTFRAELVDADNGDGINNNAIPSVAPGATYGPSELAGTMPDHAWNLRIEVWKT